MNVFGFQKTSVQDYPGKVSAIVFTKGCNFRCGYCHNPELISQYGKGYIDHQEIFSYLEKRSKMVDGMVITGGEPTIQLGLTDFIRKVKGYGLSVKIDTNGSRPDVLKRLIEEKLIDYIAMDYKYPSRYYMQLVRTDIRGNVIRESRDIVMGSGLSYEFRVTIIEKMFNEQILQAIAEELGESRLVRLQGYRNETVFDKRLKSYNNTTKGYLESAKKYFTSAKRVEISY